MSTAEKPDSQSDEIRTIAETIGAYAAEFQQADIPADVMERARYMVLDAIGIAFASGKFDFANVATQALVQTSGEATGTVIGLRGQAPVRDAVLLNSMLVHGLDFDDTYLGGGIHPTCSCFPAAFGVAEQRGASGADFLAAYVLGMEVANRLGSIAHGVLNQCGLHPSSMLGGFASAVIASWLQDMNANQIAMAQGIALGMAGGTLESLLDGSWTKRIQPGWAAASGITAASLARHGFIGSLAAYEGRNGLHAAHMGSRAAECDYAAATRALGETWTIMDVSLKPFPACHAAVPLIQAAIALQSEHELVLGDIASITAVVTPNAVKLVCEPLDSKRRPDSIYGAQFSAPYTVAATLINKKFGLEQIQETALQDERTLALAAKVGYRVDEDLLAGISATMNRRAELHVQMTDGRMLSHRVETLLGTPARPMTAEHIVAKFMDNACSVMCESRARQIMQRTLELENEPNVRDFAAILRV